VNLRLSILEGASLSFNRTTKPFMQTCGFNDDWWVGTAKRPVVFCSITTDPEGEVARAQIRPHSPLGAAYPTYMRSRRDWTEIDLLEVRADLRDLGFGHAVVGRLLPEFPSPCIAASLNGWSDRFWRSLGWAEHAHPNERGATLFVQPD
jgi:hypothetical protein